MIVGRLLKVVVLASVVMCFCAIPSRAGVVFSFSDFSSTAGLTLQGNPVPTTPTTVDGTVLRLTTNTDNQSGAAFSTTAVPLSVDDTFSTTFEFRFTNPSGYPADGITFVLAASPTGLGASGQGMGYQGVANSLAIEFDTYQNGGDPDANHVAIDTNGVLNNAHLTNPYGVTSCNTSSSSQQSGCMSNGDLWSVTIGYNGASNQLFASVWDRLGTYQESAPYTIYTGISENLLSYLGTNAAYVGFAGGTGSDHQNQDVKDWQFADDTSLGGVPEPGTLALVFGGLFGAALVRRARRCRG
jgi:hypothetical protein